MDIFNDDFRDFILALNNNKVRYILVGGYSVILHGYRRATGDMDILVDPTAENYENLSNAFRDFGLSLFDMTRSSFLSEEYDVFTFGRPPVAIDIMTKMKGISFDEAHKEAIEYDHEGMLIKLIQIHHLIIAKRASGRYKDLDDIENLTNR